MDEVKYLVEKAARGERRAMEQLIVLYQRRIVAYCSQLTGSRELGLELAQETFIKLFTRISTYNSSRSFNTWLYSVARNLCIDHLRRPSPNTEVLSDKHQVDGPQGSPSDKAMERELKDAMHLAIEKLPRQQQDVLLLFDIHGFSLLDISELEGVPVGTVKSRLSRARLALVKLMNRGTFQTLIS